MFNKEDFINDYVEAVRKNNTEEMQNVLARLTEEQTWDDRKELVEGIIAGVKELEGDHSVHQEFLSNQLQLIEVAKMEEQRKKDSASEEAKDESKAEEVTKDVAADTSADEAVERDTEEGEKAAESDGEAPTEEEKTEKTEEK